MHQQNEMVADNASQPNHSVLPAADMSERTSNLQKASPGESASVVAYVLLWFPLASETFVFREIANLIARGTSVRVYSLYGPKLSGCSREMRQFSDGVVRFGVFSICSILKAFFATLLKHPRKVVHLARKGLFRKMRNLESLGENIWSFFAGFLLAEYCQRDNIGLIHSAWANGPATSAWIASQLTGIPFAFTGRAGDIYPQDGLLREKMADAAFVRTNNRANIDWLQKFCPPEQHGKIHLVYNTLTLPEVSAHRERHHPPYRILAIGRFVRTKGFPVLLTALARLKREHFPCQLTLVGDGTLRQQLHNLRQKLHLEDIVDLPGFAPHDKLLEYMRLADVLVMPSVVHSNGDRDGIPNVIMEALSQHLPVVATDVCGIGEVIKNGETGMLVPQQDARALANAIRYMLSNPDMAMQMAASGCKRVCEMFDTDKNTKALQALYHSAASPNYPGSHASK